MALLLPGTARADETQTSIAVLDIRARGMPATIADALLDVVTEEVARAPRMKVMSRKEIERMLTEETRKQLLGCDETSCMAEIAGALNTELLVSGEVARIGTSTLLTLQLINNRFATVMNRVSINWPGDQDRLVDVAQAASQLLVLERSARKPGSIRLESLPAGAEVFLDEKPAREGMLENLDVGLHLVRISASGHDERTVPVIVKSGKISRVNAGLNAIPIFRRPLFWIVGVLGTGAAAWLVASIVVGVPLGLVIFNTGNAHVTAKPTGPDTGLHP